MPLPHQTGAEVVPAVDRDQDLHVPEPDVGTIDSAASSAIAARVAATSDRGMTSSSEAAPPPIMESSRRTDTTVASATRMRGTSYSPCSRRGADQISTTLPASTDAGTSIVLRTTTLVVRA